jgi:probable phosphoglycerate mutase
MTGKLFADAAPSNIPWFTAHCDGGSRGNPGPSGFGAVVEGPDGIVAAELSEFLGVQTNNYAEYSGLIAVLKWAVENDSKCLRVVSDSELMVKQMKGEYKVSSPTIRPLWEQARALARKLDRFEIRHTLRGGNKDADRLANEAMDKGMKQNRVQGSGVRGQEGPGASRANAYEKPPKPTNTGAPGPSHLGTWETTKPNSGTTPQVLEGYVKGGVIHLLEGELPDGTFVNIVRK